MVDKVRQWFYSSYQQRGTTMKGKVLLGLGIAAFIGVWVFILTNK